MLTQSGLDGFTNNIPQPLEVLYHNKARALIEELTAYAYLLTSLAQNPSLRNFFNEVYPDLKISYEGGFKVSFQDFQNKEQNIILQYNVITSTPNYSYLSGMQDKLEMLKERFQSLIIILFTYKQSRLERFQLREIYFFLYEVIKKKFTDRDKLFLDYIKLPVSIYNEEENETEFNIFQRNPLPGEKIIYSYEVSYVQGDFINILPGSEDIPEDIYGHTKIEMIIHLDNDFRNLPFEISASGANNIKTSRYDDIKDRDDIYCLLSLMVKIAFEPQ